MLIHPHHQFCSVCLRPKDFHHGWIGSKTSSTESLFARESLVWSGPVWSGAEHFSRFSPTHFFCVLLCVSTFAFYAASMELLPPLSDFQVERFAVAQKSLRPQLLQFSLLYIKPLSSRVLPGLPPAGSQCISQLTTPRSSPLHLRFDESLQVGPIPKNSICYLIVAVVAVIASQSASFDPLWAKLVSRECGGRAQLGDGHIPSAGQWPY